DKDICKTQGNFSLALEGEEPCIILIFLLDMLMIVTTTRIFQLNFTSEILFTFKV
uniref:Uncharacterized protein n=1 Tax=Monodelphis domestica TaxID=13616 RepID=A0A5F8HIS6_MONDO